MSQVNPGCRGVSCGALGRVLSPVGETVGRPVGPEGTGRRGPVLEQSVGRGRGGKSVFSCPQRKAPPDRIADILADLSSVGCAEPAFPGPGVSRGPVAQLVRAGDS